MSNEPTPQSKQSTQQQEQTAAREAGEKEHNAVRRSALSAHAKVLRTALVQGALALCALLVFAAVLWFAIAGLPGLWGALLGAVIAGFFVLTTAISALVTARSEPLMTGVVMLGAWLIKLIIVIAAVIALRGHDFYHLPAFVSTLLVAMVVVLTMEARAVLRAKLPYIDPA